jgi:hypothetical protein
MFAAVAGPTVPLARSMQPMPHIANDVGITMLPVSPPANA